MATFDVSLTLPPQHRQPADNGLVEQYGNDDQHIAAKVEPWNTINPRTRQEILRDDDWQKQVRKYDREGPGIVGATLDIPAATSTMVDLYPRYWNGEGYERIDDDPLVTTVLNLWAGDCVDQRTMLSRLIRTLDGPGEGYMVLHNPTDIDNMYWQLCQATNLTQNRHDRTVEVRTRPNARRGDKYHWTVPEEQVFHFHQPDPEWEGAAWSPLRRGIDHIEKYRAIMRNIGRNVDSQLAMNGILWAKAIGEKTQWQDRVKAWAHQAITKDDGIEAVVPFMMQTAEKPEFIDIGRDGSTERIDEANFYLKAYASSQDIPTNMLLEGPGQANHWNAFLENDVFADVTMTPRLNRAYKVIDDTHLRPILKLAGHPEWDKISVWGDDTRIRSKTDNSDAVMWAYDRGLASREAAAAVAQLDSGDLLDLPAGVSPFEAWLVSRAPGLAAGGATSGLGPEPGEDVVEITEAAQDQIVPGLTSGQPVRAELSEELVSL